MSALKTEVVILTRSLRIEGDIDLIKGARITDFMNEAKRFMVVMGARVCDRSGAELLKAEFINVQVAEIEVILPSDSLQKS